MSEDFPHAVRIFLARIFSHVSFAVAEGQGWEMGWRKSPWEELPDAVSADDAFSGPFDSRSLAGSFALAQGDRRQRFLVPVKHCGNSGGLRLAWLLANCQLLMAAFLSSMVVAISDPR